MNNPGINAAAAAQPPLVHQPSSSATAVPPPAGPVDEDRFTRLDAAAPRREVNLTSHPLIPRGHPLASNDASATTSPASSAPSTPRAAPPPLPPQGRGWERFTLVAWTLVVSAPFLAVAVPTLLMMCGIAAWTSAACIVTMLAACAVGVAMLRLAEGVRARQAALEARKLRAAHEGSFELAPPSGEIPR